MPLIFLCSLGTRAGKRPWVTRSGPVSEVKERVDLTFLIEGARQDDLQDTCLDQLVQVVTHVRFLKGPAAPAAQLRELDHREGSSHPAQCFHGCNLERMDKARDVHLPSWKGAIGHSARDGGRVRTGIPPTWRPKFRLGSPPFRLLPQMSLCFAELTNPKKPVILDLSDQLA